MPTHWQDNSREVYKECNRKDQNQNQHQKSRKKAANKSCSVKPFNYSTMTIIREHIENDPLRPQLQPFVAVTNTVYRAMSWTVFSITIRASCILVQQSLNCFIALPLSAISSKGLGLCLLKLFRFGHCRCRAASAQPLFAGHPILFDFAPGVNSPEMEAWPVSMGFAVIIVFAQICHNIYVGIIQYS